MRRIGPNELYHAIYVKLRTLPRRVRNLYASKLPHEGDEGTSALAKAVVCVLEAGELRIVEPDRRLTDSHGSVPGKWDPDDPDPTEGLSDTSPRSP